MTCPYPYTTKTGEVVECTQHHCDHNMVHAGTTVSGDRLRWMLTPDEREAINAAIAAMPVREPKKRKPRTMKPRVEP